MWPEVCSVDYQPKQSRCVCVCCCTMICSSCKAPWIKYKLDTYYPSWKHITELALLRCQGSWKMVRSDIIQSAVSAHRTVSHVCKRCFYARTHDIKTSLIFWIWSVFLMSCFGSWSLDLKNTFPRSSEILIFSKILAALPRILVFANSNVVAVEILVLAIAALSLHNEAPSTEDYMRPTV